MTPALPRLLLITDRRRTARGLAWAVEEALSAMPTGAAGIILREKDLDGRALLALAADLRRITRRYGSPLIVNGRMDIALACGAEGVHLGGDAPPIADVRRLWPDGVIGLSVHGTEPIPPEASYALVSPIFLTASKPGARPLGIEGLRTCCAESPVAVFALGGITASNARACLDAGAFGVAALGNVLLDTEPSVAARAIFSRSAKSTLDEG